MGKCSTVSFTIPKGMPAHCPCCFSENRRYLIKDEAWKCRKCGQVYIIRTLPDGRKRIIPNG